MGNHFVATLQGCAYIFEKTHLAPQHLVENSSLKILYPSNASFLQITQTTFIHCSYAYILRYMSQETLLSPNSLSQHFNKMGSFRKRTEREQGKKKPDIIRQQNLGTDKGCRESSNAKG